MCLVQSHGAGRAAWDNKTAHEEQARVRYYGVVERRVGPAERPNASNQRLHSARTWNEGDVVLLVHHDANGGVCGHRCRGDLNRLSNHVAAQHNSCMETAERHLARGGLLRRAARAPTPEPAAAAPPHRSHRSVGVPGGAPGPWRRPEAASRPLCRLPRGARPPRNAFLAKKRPSARPPTGAEGAAGAARAPHMSLAAPLERAGPGGRLGPI